MTGIGKRTAQLLIEREAQTGVPARKQLENMGMRPRNLSAWQSEGRNPGGYALSQMALAGYDVMYILTGRRTTT